MLSLLALLPFLLLFSFSSSFQTSEAPTSQQINTKILEFGAAAVPAASLGSAAATLQRPQGKVSR